MIEIHIAGKGLSGKAVRLRTLSPSEVDKVLDAAAKTCGVDATNVAYMRTEQKFGAEAMLVSITTKPVAAIPAPEATWEPWDEHKPQLQTKDWELLRKVYVKTHAVSGEEVDAILGKALEVAED